jgi:nucleoside-diphosphate-sugar epimerase
MSGTLVVGGAGFLAGHTIPALLSEGRKVTAMDVVAPDGARRITEFIEKKQVQYSWKSAIDITADDFNDINNVIFLGAIADVPLAIKSPMYTFQTNVLGVVNYMDKLSKLQNPPRTIYMSSESVYGRIPIEKQPIVEDVTLNPTNAYAASKASAEIVVRSYSEQFNLPTVILRSTTMYGEASRSKQVVPIFIRQALASQNITVEGDGSQSRDFNYVLNMVSAIMKVIDNDSIRSGIYNIGSGVEVSIKELAEMIIKISGSPSTVVNGPWRPGEQGIKLNVSIDKAKKELGYIPVYSLEQGLTNTIEWIRTHP